MKIHKLVRLSTNKSAKVLLATTASPAIEVYSGSIVKAATKGFSDMNDYILIWYSYIYICKCQ